MTSSSSKDTILGRKTLKKKKKNGKMCDNLRKEKTGKSFTNTMGRPEVKSHDLWRKEAEEGKVGGGKMGGAFEKEDQRGFKTLKRELRETAHIFRDPI